jgi:hypothetical protein
LFLLVVVIRTIRARHLPERLPLATGLIASFVAMIGVPVSPPLTWMLLLAGVGWTLTARPAPPDQVTRSYDVAPAELAPAALAHLARVDLTGHPADPLP